MKFAIIVALVGLSAAVASASLSAKGQFESRDELYQAPLTQSTYSAEIRQPVKSAQMSYSAPVYSTKGYSSGAQLMHATKGYQPTTSYYQAPLLSAPIHQTSYFPEYFQQPRYYQSSAPIKGYQPESFVQSAAPIKGYQPESFVHQAPQQVLSAPATKGYYQSESYYQQPILSAPTKGFSQQEPVRAYAQEPLIQAPQQILSAPVKGYSHQEPLRSTYVQEPLMSQAPVKGYSQQEPLRATYAQEPMVMSQTPVLSAPVQQVNAAPEVAVQRVK